jgi:hypothetical protein
MRVRTESHEGSFILEIGLLSFVTEAGKGTGRDKSDARA